MPSPTAGRLDDPVLRSARGRPVADRLDLVLVLGQPVLELVGGVRAPYPVRRAIEIHGVDRRRGEREGPGLR